MNIEILNEKPFQVYLILAETLEGWKNPTTEEGKKVLLEHYAWVAELKAKNKLLLAGPTDFELTSTHKINPVGHITGVIILNVGSREEAEEWAYKDPFHLHGFRKNAVLSFRVTMTDDNVYNTLNRLLA